MKKKKKKKPPASSLIDQSFSDFIMHVFSVLRTYILIIFALERGDKEILFSSLVNSVYTNTSLN